MKKTSQSPTLRIKMENDNFSAEIQKAIEEEKLLKKWLSQGTQKPLNASEALREAQKIVNFNTKKSIQADEKSL